MLQKIHIQNFKSYKNQDLHLAPLTLMIGANASGKSNAIEAFRFLCWLAGGQKLSVLQNAVNDSEKIIRGNVWELFYPESDSFVLGGTTDDKTWNTFEVELDLRNNEELHIKQEKITAVDEKVPLYEIKQISKGLGTDVSVAYNNFANGGKKPQIRCTDQITIMNQLSGPAPFAAKDKKAQKEIPKITNRFQELLSNTLFLDPVPYLMREDSYPNRRLQGNCSNLSGVLYTLWENEKNRPAILDFIKSLPEQDIKDIRFSKNGRGEVYLELVENFGNQERSQSAGLLSDGTLRVLAIAAALLSVQEGSTVVIEEVDNGIHPSRARQLLETMQRQAEKRKIRLLLSTHNPALMDALPDNALGDVVFCYRDMKEGDSRLIKLSDLSDYPELILQGKLGGLVTKGIVDRFVKNPVDKEEKKRKALAWLENIKGNS